MFQKNILSELIKICYEAGVLIMDIYNKEFEINYKSDSSPVTNADKSAEEYILKKLNNIFPDIPVISEESYSNKIIPNYNKKFFLVDPLDGTKEFLKFDGKGSFTVNIALIRENEPLIGIVYAPAIKRLFYAGKTFGSFEENKDGIKKIRIRKSDKNKIVAVASSSHLDQKTKDWLVKNNIARTVSIGSSLKFCLVASGEADVYPRFGPTMEWDTAAGDAVLRYAGGSVEYLDSSKFTYGKKNFKNTPFIAKGDF